MSFANLRGAQQSQDSHCAYSQDKVQRTTLLFKKHMPMIVVRVKELLRPVPQLETFTRPHCCKMHVTLSCPRQWGHSKRVSHCPSMRSRTCSSWAHPRLPFRMLSEGAPRFHLRQFNGRLRASPLLCKQSRRRSQNRPEGPVPLFLGNLNVT